MRARRADRNCACAAEREIAEGRRRNAFKLSVNDLLIKAAAVTLRRVPNVNASYTDDALILYDDVDISMAVSIPDGLITPIVRQADRKGLAAISQETKIPDRARACR